MHIAAFDLDGTLVRGDLVVPFLRRAAGLKSLTRACARVELVAALRHRDRDTIKAIAACALRGVRTEHVLQVAEGLSARAVARDLNPSVLRQWTAAGERGARRVIVSASFEPYVEMIGAHLGADAILATGLESTDGVLTGHLSTPNCRGANKVHRLEEQLAAWSLTRADVHVSVWGDSTGDREMLAWADRAHLVR
ncbi:MAG: HAD-IB family hydrolase [Actinomycetota bacterium]|nr:HAD-IB family hydrolase [Actinomycetota bacterium]